MIGAARLSGRPHARFSGRMPIRFSGRPPVRFSGRMPIRFSRFFRSALLCVVAFYALTCVASAQTLRDADALAQAPYRQSTLSVAERTQDLLSRMTMDEKIGQMILVDWRFLSSPHDIRLFHLGALLGGGGARPPEGTPIAWADMLNEYQSIATNTILGIPLLIGNDAVHGVGNLKDATIFPHHIGLGATRNAALVERIGEITATELIAIGVNWNYSPAVSVPQDIRWGRAYEGFSSHTQTVSELSSAEIHGLQRKRRVVATAKHFIADGGTSLGTDRGDARITTQELERIHLPPYIAAIKADVGVVMASYSSVNEQKMHGNRDLIQGVLKERLGFSGFVVSDWAAIYELEGSLDEQLAASINAGVDMIMVPERYQELAFAFHRVVATGAVSAARIDDAVTRILRVKFGAQLFETPYADEELQDTIGSAEHRAVARQAVSESIVLLQNQNGALPLSASERRPILITGAYADDIGVQSGGWTIEWQGARGDITAGDTILEAFTAELGAGVVYIPTVRGLLEQSFDADAFAAVITVIGETPYAEGVGDSRFPRITAMDSRLVQTAADMFDAPIITLIISGRPLVMQGITESSDAIVALWLPGSEGAGVSDVLLGKRNFTGVLPYKWPAERTGFTAKGKERGALFPRGHGLKYY